MGLNISMQMVTTEGPISLVIQLAQTPAEATIIISESGEPVIDEDGNQVVAE